MKKKRVTLRLQVTVDENTERREVESIVKRALNSAEEVGLNPEARVLQEDPISGTG